MTEKYYAKIKLPKNILFKTLRSSLDERLINTFKSIDEVNNELKDKLNEMYSEKNQLHKIKVSFNNEDKLNSLIQLQDAKLDGNIYQFLSEILSEDANSCLIQISLKLPTQINRINTGYSRFSDEFSRGEYCCVFDGYLASGSSTKTWDSSSIKRIVYQPSYDDSLTYVQIRISSEYYVKTRLDFSDRIKIFGEENSLEYFVYNFNQINHDSLLYNNLKYIEQSVRKRYSTVSGPRRVGTFFITALIEKYFAELFGAEKMSKEQSDFFGIGLGDNKPDLVLLPNHCIEIKLNMDLEQAVKAIKSVNMNPQPTFVCIVNTLNYGVGTVELYPLKELDKNEVVIFSKLKRLIDSADISSYINIHQIVQKMPSNW